MYNMSKYVYLFAQSTNTQHFSMECEWDRLRRSDKEIRDYINKYVTVPNFHKRKITQARLLEMVASGDIYGCGTMDLSVPDHLKDRFSEFGPFIVKRDIKFEVA